MSRCSIHTHTLRDMLKIFGNGVQDQKSLEVTVLVQNSQKITRIILSHRSDLPLINKPYYL